MDLSGWKAIDIYLFTNGQEQSPPRKYHLTDDELDMWDDTLSKLGVSQNGYVNQPIEIYTINGEKISSPMELKNGGTYVAVNLGETFISARYKRYIMKATRSWEKRKVKKLVELPTTPKATDIQEEYGDLGKSSRREVIINIENLYKQKNSDFSPKNSRAKSPYEAASLPSPDTCNIVDSTLIHSPWYDDVNIHKVQIEKGIFKGSVKKKRYKNSVRSAKSSLNAQDSKQSPVRKTAPVLPIKKKVVPKSTHSPVNAAKRRKIAAHKTSPLNKSSRPQMKGKKSTPSDRSIRSNDTKTSDIPTEVNKWLNDPSQFTSDSEQSKDQQKSAPVKEAIREASSENRIEKSPEPRQRWSLNDDVINSARNSRDETPTLINRNLSNPVNDPVKPYTQPEVRTQKNYILLKPDNTAIIVDGNAFKSMSPDELNQYISYGAINRIASPDTNNDQVKDVPAEEPDNHRQRSASTASRKSVNIDDTNIQHIPPSSRVSNVGKSISPGPEIGKKFSREEIYNSLCIQTLATNKPNLIDVSQEMCTSSYVQKYLPTAINMDLRGRSLYRQILRKVDGDYPLKSPGSLYPKCSNLYNVTFNSTERVSPSKVKKTTVQGVGSTSMGPRNVNVPQPNYKSHTHRYSTNVSDSPYKDNWITKYSNKYDYVPPKVITRHANDIPQIKYRVRSKSDDGRSTKVDRTISSTSANTEIRKRSPQTQSPRHVDISQLNPRRTVSRYTSFTTSNDTDLKKIGSDVASTKSDGIRNQTMKSVFPQVKSSQSSQSINEKRSHHNNFSKSNNNEQQNTSPTYSPRDLSKATNKENMLPNDKSISTSPIYTRSPTEKSISTSPINTKSPTENLRIHSQVRHSTPSNAISGKSYPNVSTTSNNNDQRNKSPRSQTPRQLNIPQQHANSLIPKSVSNRFTFTTPENIPPNVKSAATSPVSIKSSNEATKNQTISDKRFPYRNNYTISTNNTQQNRSPPTKLPQINIPHSPNNPTPLRSNRNAYKAPPISTKLSNETSTNQIISERRLLSINNKTRNRNPLRQENIPQQRSNSPVSAEPPKYLNDYRNRLQKSDFSAQIKKSVIKPKQTETANIRNLKSDFINKKSPSLFKHDLVITGQPRIKSLYNSHLNKTKLSVDNTVSSNPIKEFKTLSQTKPKLDDVNNIDLNKYVSSDMQPNLDRPDSTRNLNTNVIKVDIPQLTLIDNMSPNISKETEPSFDKTESPQTAISSIMNIQQDTFKTNEKNAYNSKEAVSSFDKTESPQSPQNEFTPITIIQQDTFKSIEKSIDNRKETESSFDKTESPQLPQTEFIPITIIQQDTFKSNEKNVDNSKGTESSFDKTESPQSPQTEFTPITIIQQDTFKSIEKSIDNRKETESSFDKTESPQLPQTEFIPITIIQQDTFKTNEKNVDNSKGTESSFDKTESPQSPQTEFTPITIIQQDIFINDKNVDNSKEEDILPSEKMKDETEMNAKNAIEEQSNYIDNKILDEFILKNIEAMDTVVDKNGGDDFSENESVKRSSVESAGKITPAVDQPVSDGAGAKNEITAVVGKGDIFNLKLNLNGKNVEGLITIDKANKDESPQTMNLNQSSQTNLNIMFKEKPTNEETTTDVSCSASETGNKMPNVIVVQCACCENVNVEELRRTLPKALDNYNGDANKCIVFLPSDSKCAEKSRDALSPYAYSDNGCKDFSDECGCEIPENLGITKTGVEDQVKPYRMYIEPETESKVPPPATPTPTLALNDSVVKTVPKCTDSSTQTDWQDALLIPVIHEDGHITFKFPSLETVKNM